MSDHGGASHRRGKRSGPSRRTPPSPCRVHTVFSKAAHGTAGGRILLRPGSGEPETGGRLLRPRHGAANPGDITPASPSGRRGPGISAMDADARLLGQRRKNFPVSDCGGGDGRTFFKGSRPPRQAFPDLERRVLSAGRTSPG